MALRLARDRIMVGLCLLALAAALLPLGSVLWDITGRGLAAMTLDFLTQSSRGSQGLGNAIVGTGMVVAVAAIIGTPFGVGAGIYMSEYGHRRLARATRFLAEVLSGLPSNVAGIVAYGLLVATTKTQSVFAGGVALSFLFIPVVAIATQEALALVPRGHREASLALGLGESTTALRVIVPAATGGILTGILLSVARIAGETAPLIFTLGNIDGWPSDLFGEGVALSYRLFDYTRKPSDLLVSQAWAAALFLVLLILVTNVAARALWARRARFLRGASIAK
jgi:phosphate transport system permease protein